MQSLRSNMQTVYVAKYSGITDNVKDGMKTGGKAKNYNDVFLLRANVSAAKGIAETEPFGVNADYERVLSTCEKVGITEESILWIGFGRIDYYDATKTYTLGNITIKDGFPMILASGGWVKLPYNYRVVRVAEGINCNLYALKKVV